MNMYTRPDDSSDTGLPWRTVLREALPCRFRARDRILSILRSTCIVEGSNLTSQPVGGSVLIDVPFRLQLITGPSDGPRFADARLALRDTDIRSIPTGMQVAVERRQDLEVPERP
jgi:hypothetical protein